MISLGIESSAHTFSVALVNDKGKILAETRDMYTREDGGIIPADAAKHHREIREKLLGECFNMSCIVSIHPAILASTS